MRKTSSSILARAPWGPPLQFSVEFFLSETHFHVKVIQNGNEKKLKLLLLIYSWLTKQKIPRQRKILLCLSSWRSKVYAITLFHLLDNWINNSHWRYVIKFFLFYGNRQVGSRETQSNTPLKLKSVVITWKRQKPCALVGQKAH